METLASKPRVTHDVLWRHVQRLLERMVGVLENEALVEDCLDIVMEFLDADRGLVIWKHEDGTTQPFIGRAAGRALDALEREEISKTLVHRAFESGEPVVWTVADIQVTAASTQVLGIFAAIAVPLYGAGRAEAHGRGVLYVDFRDPRKHVEEQQIEFTISAALLLGVVLEQRRLTEAAQVHLRATRERCLDASAAPSLDALLAPPGMADIRDEIRSASTSDAPMLILGEPGTGKTLIARAVAEAGTRRPIVRAMLGTSDDLNTITSELFGHERGAFSGAMKKRVGLVELAHNGTLLLDEVLNLAPQAQALLLDFAQFGTYRPLGYERAEPKRANVRLIASTNGDLDLAMREGRFRRDLYHRLSAIEITVPALRARRDDVPMLVEATLRRIDATRTWSVSVPLRRLLLSDAWTWEGNVRELESTVRRARERAVAAGSQGVLEPEHFVMRAHPVSPAEGTRNASTAETLEDAWKRLQRSRLALETEEHVLIRKALASAEGVVARAARELGIARTTLASRVEVLAERDEKRLGG